MPMAEVMSNPESPVVADGNVVVRPQPFTIEETAAFQQADRQAAKMVAGLMLAIFTMALLGYSLICFLALRGGS
jgi:hypothetical protein